MAVVVRVRVLFFGMLKDIVGRAEEDLEIEQGCRLGTIFERYAERHPRLRDYGRGIVVARNQQLCSRSDEVADGDEVAFLPPVSGGSGAFLHEIADKDGHFFALTREPIDTHALTERLLRGEDGAVVAFQGVARNNAKGRSVTCLEYECYEPMAVKVMARIGREIAGAHAIGRIGIIHRLGRLRIGEASVAVVVTAPHRKAAFEAAQEGIDRLKRLAPIWKKEHFADGEAWVEGQWDESVLKR
jgi:molybdopterin synthase catalytic subunit/molybdopterin converting factor small subunit